LPLSLLSSLSILGIVSTLFIVAVVLIDGLSKREAPGSLWEPAATVLLPTRLGELGVAFGLLMAGFSGHAVIPSLARDMADPSRFEEVINWAFVSGPSRSLVLSLNIGQAVVTAIYMIIGTAGYAMFGRAVHDEVSTP
jgi:vesicular inhibitory amino acid transporter